MFQLLIHMHFVFIIYVCIYFSAKLLIYPEIMVELINKPCIL